MAACAVFSHPLSVDARVQSNQGLFLHHRCATPHQLRVPTITREAKSCPALQNRSIVSSAVQEYLKSLNFMTRTIVLETETVEKNHRERWTSLDQTKREELVNEHFIPSGVRVQYTSGFVGGWQRMPRGNSVDNRPLHLSQPTGEEEWKSLLIEGHCDDPSRCEKLVVSFKTCRHECVSVCSFLLFSWSFLLLLFNIWKGVITKHRPFCLSCTCHHLRIMHKLLIVEIGFEPH